jgi:hypothetical protein
MINDTNSMFNNFLNTYLKGFNHCFPIYRKQLYTHLNNKWITKGIMISCKKKKLLHILNQHTQNQTIKTYCKEYCAILSRMILNAKKTVL